MKLKWIIATLVLITVSAFTLFQAAQWKVTDGYVVQFTSKRVNGTFRGLKANILFDENNLAASKISASIAAKTIDTGIWLRNRHATSESGLNAEKSPEISFESSRIVKTGSGYEATGKLTIREVSREIKLPFTFKKEGTKGLFIGKFTISPKDYNVTKSGTPDAVDIELEVPVNN